MKPIIKNKEYMSKYWKQEKDNLNQKYFSKQRESTPTFDY